MREDVKTKEKLYKRQIIVDTAEELFHSKGVKLTSMDELAKESGFTKRTIYSYFSSKDEIYYEVMIKAYKQLNFLIKEKNESKSITSELHRIKVIGSVLIEFNETNNTGFKAIFDFENNDIDNILKNEVAAKCYEEGEYLTKVFLDSLREGIRKGEIKESIDINKTFLSFWSCLVGVTNLINYKKEYIKRYLEVDINESLDYSFDLIINSIRKEVKNEGE